jgi:CRP-like cAMP-binding protein
LDVVILAAVRREYQANHAVSLEDDPCVGLYAVETGCLKAVKASPQGRAQVLRFRGPGDVFKDVGSWAMRATLPPS